MKKPKGSFFNKKFKLTHLIIVCLVVAALTAGVTYVLTIGGIGSKQYFDNAKAYVEIEKIINENYIGSVDDDTLFNAAASAMVRSIDDKWSYYMSPEEYAAYKLTSSNEYAGIGISVKQNDSGDFEIFSVDSGTPAEAAGLTAGQLIVSVDGQPVADMTLSEMQELIRSKLNKDFPMVVSDKKGNEVSVTVACEIIYKDPVSSRMLDGNIGYIKIANFEAGSSEGTINAIERLVAEGAMSFIFDVRNNPGGLLSELVSLLDYLLPDGDLFISVDKQGNETVKTSDKICLSSKMAVLVNANTYSAAEFFAAALQEYDWATIVGEHTTGKARSQITLELSNGGAVHISTHKYLTPDRVDLSEVGGIKPDIEAVNTNEDPQIQLNAAINALK
ncbi:MAG: S41 family peptidase [Oscillospiraceae bacterium]